MELNEWLEIIGKPSKTPEEKYEQLIRPFNENENVTEAMRITIKHVLKQSGLIGSYCGFSLGFWTEVMGCYLKNKLGEL